METRFDYGFTGHEPRKEELERGRERYLLNLYTGFVEPYLEEEYDDASLFQPWNVSQNIRPPYTSREIEQALELASDDGNPVELVEEDMKLWKYEPGL